MRHCGCMEPCMPKCTKTCVKVFRPTYKLYKICCYRMVKQCECCGKEYDYRRHAGCPHCGRRMMDDPPRFGRFDRFGEFNDFDRFRMFGFGFEPEFEPFEFGSEFDFD